MASSIRLSRPRQLALLLLHNLLSSQVVQFHFGLHFHARLICPWLAFLLGGPDHFQPESEKSHMVIEETAKFVARKGKPAEDGLRAKHASNPNFAFLLPSNPL